MVCYGAVINSSENTVTFRVNFGQVLLCHLRFTSPFTFLKLTSEMRRFLFLVILGTVGSNANLVSTNSGYGVSNCYF